VLQLAASCSTPRSDSAKIVLPSPPTPISKKVSHGDVVKLRFIFS
jgi:hypothetical protein